MRVAADLRGDVAAQTAQPREVLAFGGLGELPPDMQLLLALGRAAAAFDDQRRRPRCADEVVELGGDVAGVEIDHDRLHLQDVGGLRLALLGDGAGDDIDRSALARTPRWRRWRSSRARRVGVDPDVVRLAVHALALVDEAAHRDQAVAIAEDHVEEDGDLRRRRARCRTGPR